MEIKDLLRNMRTAHGWTTTEIAQKAGMAQSTYSRLENGGRVPKPATLSKIAAAYGLPDNYFTFEIARQQSDTAQFGDTNNAVFAQIPDTLASFLTSDKLTEVADCINAAYHRGKADAGAEMIDSNCVYINSTGRMIEWDKNFVPKFIDEKR
jgi:transcriptional regulator with XRE-family HTH domain